MGPAQSNRQEFTSPRASQAEHPRTGSGSARIARTLGVTQSTAAGKPDASVRSAEIDRKIPVHILKLRREEKSTSHQEKNLMSENDMREEAVKPLDADGDESRENDSVASKLSQELSNWRQRRSSTRPSRPNAPAQNHSEPARTIKVRGHETLVVRKPKLVQKPPTNPSASD
jgi:hypothetical protein